MKLRYAQPRRGEDSSRTNSVIEIDVRRQGDSFSIGYAGEVHEVEIDDQGDDWLNLRIDGRPVRALVGRAGDRRTIVIGRTKAVVQRIRDDRSGRPRRSKQVLGPMMSNMPGQVLKVLTEKGDRVSKGQTLLVVEAMKMEHEMKAPRDALVREVRATVGATIQPGVVLIEFEELAEDQ